MVKHVRRILPVAEGQRGIRQSDAVFLHIKQFPDLFSQLARETDMRKVKAVGVSVKPRNAEGSYMPVFLAGEAFAVTAAQSLRVPLYRFSHQDGHIMAAIYSSKAFHLLSRPFLSVHLSGGTTEILKTAYDGFCFSQEIIGGTKDISAGQFIDRTGVAMGLSFPCGRAFERMAEKAGKTIALPVCTDGAFMNFSGVETKVSSMLKTGEYPNEVLALSVQEQIAGTLGKALCYAVKSTGLSDILLAGGVISNHYIKKRITQTVRAELYFAQPEYASDNAAGIALLTQLGGKHDGTDTENRNSITN